MNVLWASLIVAPDLTSAGGLLAPSFPGPPWRILKGWSSGGGLPNGGLAIASLPLQGWEEALPAQGFFFGLALAVRIPNKKF